jgi:hypothetical protein
MKTQPFLADTGRHTKTVAAELPDALTLALAPFAPPSSDLHRQADEAARRADLAIDAMKNSGELRRRDDQRAVDLQTRCGAP